MSAADINGGGGDGKIQRMARESKVRGASKEARSPDSGSVTAREWERKAERKGNLAEFMAASPLRRSGLKLKRLPVRLRRVEL